MPGARPRAAKIWLATFFALLILMAWSMVTRLVIEGHGWRFGLHEARLGIETWDSSTVPAGMIPGGPWYIHGYATDMRPLEWCEYDFGVRGYPVHYFYVTILPLVPVPLIVSVVLWPRRRRFGPGLCQSCGYDRNGLAIDAACPECGSTP
jgi:hypothetical protein